MTGSRVYTPRRPAQAGPVSTSEATTSKESLTVQLEDAATRRGWVSTLGLLAGAMQQWHFVAILDNQVRYESDTFSAPYSWGHLPLGRTMLPREAWAPGMDQALTGLRQEIIADGWVETGHGAQPWEDHFVRAPASHRDANPAGGATGTSPSEAGPAAVAGTP